MIPSALTVVGVVALSFLKPMVFSRYFVVLLPALIPCLAVEGARVPLNPRGQATALMTMALLVLLWWQQAFLGIGPQLGGGRESDNFRAVSQLTAGVTERFSPRSRLLNLSDQMELAAGRLIAPAQPWGNRAALAQRLEVSAEAPVGQIVLAASGPELVLRRRLQPMQEQVEQAGMICSALKGAPPFTRVLQCQSATNGPGAV